MVALHGRLGHGPCEAFGIGLPVIAGPLRVVFPDASVSCEPASDRALVDPVVVVEVISTSAAGYDLGDKAVAYRRLPSLRHLVLVFEDRLHVQHLHRGAADEDFAVTDLINVDGALELSVISAEITLAELYAGVPFGD